MNKTTNKFFNHKTSMQPSKIYMWQYQETIQLVHLAQMNNFQEFTYNTDKYWPHFQCCFIGPENHWFKASSSKGVARIFFRRRLYVDYHSWQRKFWDFRLVKMVTFDIVPACVLITPLTNQNGFKSRINRHLLTLGSFWTDFLYTLIFLCFFFL